MPRIRRPESPESTIPMSIPGSDTEGDNDGQSSDVGYTPPSSDEHPSPSYNKSVKINNGHNRTLKQITEEANMCLASQRAFDWNDPAFNQINDRLRELTVEYKEVLEGDHDLSCNSSPIDAFDNEYDEHEEQDHSQDSEPDYGQDDKQDTAIRTHIPFARMSLAHAGTKSFKRVSPKLKTFDEVHRQLRKQDKRPPRKQSLQHQESRKYLPGSFSSGPEAQQGDVVVTGHAPTLKQCKSTTAIADDKKHVAPTFDSINYFPHAVCEDYSDSDSGSVSNIGKFGPQTKPSNIKIANGFASFDNTTAPDGFMVCEFLEIADYKFTPDEAFEILRMCGANLIAAVSVYRNARDSHHLRQMLRAWLAPLENYEFEAATQFYAQEVNQQGNSWGVSSTEKVNIEEDDSQSITATMSVRDVLTLPNLDTLWAAPWTKAMDEKRLRWKTDEVKIKWSVIADSLDITAQECKDRFNVLRPSKGKANPTKERKSEQQQGDTVNAPSVRAVIPEIGRDPAVLDEPLDSSKSCGWPKMPYLDCGRECQSEGKDAEQTRPASHAAGWDTASVNEPPEMFYSSYIATTSDTASASTPKAPVPGTYTVTCWAAIESGDKIFHVPVDRSNVSGPEMAIIEGSTGMKKVWKWVQEKGLVHTVSLQDAFDLAKDMHGEDENDQSVAEEPQVAQETSRSFSRHSDVHWAAPAAHNAAPECTLNSYGRSRVSSFGSAGFGIWQDTENW